MFSNNLLMAAASASGGDAYSVGNSVRFNDNNSAYMSRTPTSAGNRDVWTLSVWVKLADWDTTSKILHAGDSSDFTHIYFSHATATDSNLEIVQKTSAAYDFDIYSTMQLRDPTSWYHILVKYDSGADSGSRILAWVNNVAVSWTQRLSRGTEPSSGLDSHVNNTVAHYIGRANTAADYWDGYMSQFTLIDGTAYDTTDFGELDNEGEWRPKNVTALTFGTNGFLQDYAVAPGTDDGAGTDVSGNDNHFASSGLAANDQVTDTPTNNFCTWSAQGVASNSNTGVTLSNGNLEWDTTANGGWWNSIGTHVVTSGKWYYEQTIDALGAYRSNCCGWSPTSESNSTRPGSSANSFCLLDTDGSYRNNGSETAYIGSAFVATEVMCCAVDFDNGKIWWRKDGDAWPNSGNPATGANPAVSFTPSGGYRPVTSTGDSGADQTVNFGQTSPNAGGNADDNGYGDFDNAPPSGFLALCTANMTDLAFDVNEHRQVELVDHDGTSTSFTLGWNADTYDTLFIIKNRDSSEKWFNVDGLNGYDKYYENNYTTQFEDSGIIEVSGTTITLGDSTALSADNYVIECHRAGAKASRETDNDAGSITGDSDNLIISANTVTQFSILTFTGTGADATVGHGLSGVSFLISYADAAESKGVGHTKLNWTHNLYINTSGAAIDDDLAFQDIAPSPTVITYGSHLSFNKSSTAMTTYCWDAVPGYSAMGKWDGNQLANGPFASVDFKPDTLWAKDYLLSGGSAQEWICNRVLQSDTKVNEADNSLFFDGNWAEGTGGNGDFLSTGFKVRETGKFNTTSSTSTIWVMFGTPTVNLSSTPAKAR